MRKIFSREVLRSMPRRQTVWTAALIVAGVALILTAPAHAATGDEIFKEAAETIACKVVPAKFGAMLAGFAGVFALLAAVTGSYKGAWALLFVSIGAFIFPEVIKVLFSGTIGAC